jgi:type II secretory pathway pseudopilin PulG
MTLVEICLVLALMVIIAAIAVPAMVGTFSRAALTGGGAIVRGGLAKARLTAMQSGQIQVFRFELKGARFQLVRLNQVSLPESEELRPDDPDAEHAAGDVLRLPENRLPDGVIFAAGDVATSAQVMATLDSPKDGPWSDPILFNPDGTTSDASLLLQNDQGLTIRVTLRGLTGIASVSEVGNEAAP